MPQRYQNTKIYKDLNIGNHFLCPRIKLIFSLLLVFLSLNAFSQDGSKIFVSDEPFEPKATGILSFEINNLNFFKNNEYKSEYVDGYTLTGTWIRPKFLFYPDTKLRLELGGQVLSYNGRDDYKLYPWFSVLYMPTKHLSFRMGNLNQDQNHGLSEPLLDSEHFLKEKPEAGFQAKFKNKRLKADLWIDWQKMIFQGDPYKERFTFGTVTELTLFKTDKQKLSLPLTFNGMHEGGEIDNAPGLAKTHIAISEGLKYNFKTIGSLIKSWSLEGIFLQSSYPLNETALPGRHGNGFFFRASFVSDYGRFTPGFWQGNKFYTPLGMPLFQNSAIGQPFATNPNRLWTFSYLYDRKIFDQSKFGFTFDLFYNPASQKISNSAALYLMVNLSVLLKRSAS